MKNTAGIFNNRQEASKAIADLVERGFEPKALSLLMSDETRKERFHDESISDETAKGGLSGAAIGGVLGALLGGLTAIGSLTVPGVGILAAGPLVAILTGAGAGGTIGGLSGALIKAGFSDHDARHFEDKIAKGDVVLVVHIDNEKEQLAANEILRAHNAVIEMA
ncbi:MAG: hypothetical protein K2Q12_10485 [Rickettsiales bacterium]|nr:hypothetical protein [Rickettsiales bacterium]